MKKIMCLLWLHCLVKDEILWRLNSMPKINEKFIIRQCMDCWKVIYINKKL